MKYVRKIAVLIIAVVLLASAVIGAGVIFAVKNVNITLYSYEFEAEGEAAKAKIAEFKNAVLSEVRGNMIFSVSEEKIETAVSEGNYYYISEFKKVYPCTINLVIREHREMFALKNADGSFSIYDENGLLLRTAEDACNNADGLPNLVVEGVEESDLKDVALACGYFADNFVGIRSVADGAVLARGSLEDTFTVNLKCGVKIIIYNFAELTGEKISAAYDCFAGLSGDNKQKGEIHCYETSDKTVLASYR